MITNSRSAAARMTDTKVRIAQKRKFAKLTEMPMPQVKGEPKVHHGKHAAISNGEQSVINEAVGVHFRVKQGEAAPLPGDHVLVKFGKSEVVLLVSHTQECVDGTTLVQAFCGLKGWEGQHIKLGAHKGQMASIFWGE